MTDTVRHGDRSLLHKISILWFGLALCCIPVWWMTTSVERKPISYDKIKTLFEKSSEVPDHKSLMTLSDNYDILLSLVLPNANADWNIEENIGEMESWIHKMRPFADFSITTQIIHHPGKLPAPASSTWSKSDISAFINSLESYLQSNQNPNSKIVQMIVYVTETELKFEHASTSAILPDWGILQVKKANPGDIDGKIIDSRTIVENLLVDLEVLFGGDTITAKSIATDKFIKSSAESLNSLSNLVQRVRNMVINEQVSENIEVAVDAAMSALETNDIDERLSLARKAFRMSEGAFFDPSLLELLYFPEDQKFAIYIPLFLPVGLPILSRFRNAFMYFRSAMKVKSD